MVDVILSSDSLTVLGGPETLEVDLNIGPSGKRGGVFFTGLQNPNNLNPDSDFPSVPQTLDFYINVNTSSPDYLQFYQYVLNGASLTWVKTFNLNSESYSVNKVISFSAGDASVDIDITDLGISSLPFEDFIDSFSFFNVQITTSNLNADNAPDGGSLFHFPAAVSINVKDAFFDGTGLTDPEEFPLKITVDLKGVEFNGSSWSLIDDKDIIVYFTITYANPDEILSILLGGGS
jgi:hypothetical protein